MGYFIKSGHGPAPHSNVSVTDEAWLDLIAHASAGGYSAPHLQHLERADEPVHIDDDEAKALRDALSNALNTSLKDMPIIVPDGESLDRRTVHRITHVLSLGDVHLERTPYWR